MTDTKPPENEHVHTEEQKRAAAVIQHHWKGRNDVKSDFMDSGRRWRDAAVAAELKMNRAGALKGKNSPKQRWQRAAFFARRLQDGNETLDEVGVPHEETGARLKNMETQHWLELIDGKHRYGANLKYYHQRWKDSETRDNFFRWLDYGEGKDLSLDECPRDQLEAERIQYLSTEQRLNYLVSIDSEGKLRWSKNNELVDTSAGKWKDSGDGAGIVPEDVPVAGTRPAGPTQRRSFSSSAASLSSSDSSAAAHYAGEKKGRNAVSKAFHRYFTLKGIFGKLLRKTIRKNTWIYVTDKNFNILVGIKDPGSFQHSSLAAGGLVTSAGLISVKDGVIHTLSPLSGHYRTSIDHFEHFLDILKERGVDMHRAEVSKAYAALWGIEHLGKFQKKEKEVVNKGKDKVKSAAVKMKDVVTSGTSDSSWKKDVLYGRKKEANGGPEEGKEEEGKPARGSPDAEDAAKTSGNGDDVGYEEKPPIKGDEGSKDADPQALPKAAGAGRNQESGIEVQTKTGDISQ